MDVPFPLIEFSIILLMGLLVSVLSQRIKVSRTFFLVFAGMILGMFSLVDFSNEFIISFSILALSLIIFGTVSQIKMGEFMRTVPDALKVAGVFLFLEMAAMPFFSNAVMGWGIYTAFLFSAVMYGIDPAAVLSAFSKSRLKGVRILEVESIINTPVTIVLPLLILDIGSSRFRGGILAGYMERIIVITIISFITGYALAKALLWIMDYIDGRDIKYLSILTTTLLSYLVAEAIRGSGVLSVSVFTVVFAASMMRDKVFEEEVMRIISSVVEVIAFMLIGSMIVFRIEHIFQGVVLFTFYLFIRYLAVCLTLDHLSGREKLLLTLNVAKGVDVGMVVLYIIAVLSSPHKELLVEMSFLFILFSLVISTVYTAFSQNHSKSIATEGK